LKTNGKNLALARQKRLPKRSWKLKLGKTWPRIRRKTVR
jgi:hypothetical protein